MKILWRLGKEAIRHKKLYIIAILSTMGLTAVNLIAPRLLSRMTGLVERGISETGLKTILILTMILLSMYLLRVLFRFLSNYMAHKAAWYLVGDLRTRTYGLSGHTDGFKDFRSSIGLAPGEMHTEAAAIMAFEALSSFA